LDENLQDALQSYLTGALPDRQGLQIRDLTRINAGWESDVYAFTAEHGPAGARQGEGLILRMYPGNDAYDKSAREFQCMHQLAQLGYPVPRVHLLERERSPFGQPFVIMERVEGQVLWPLLSRSSGEQQQRLLTLFCQLFVQLHSLPWQPFDSAQGRPFAGEDARTHTDDPYAVVAGTLDKWRPYVTGFPLPGFLPVWEWLEARGREVVCPRPAPVHWDFHPENVLVRTDGSAVVIDWTGFDVSDPRFDLAWTLLLITAYEGPHWREPILREYERLAGGGVERLEFFDVAACFRRLFSIAVSLSAGAESLGMRPGAEHKMKQAEPIRRIYDLLLERTGIRVPEVERLLQEC